LEDVIGLLAADQKTIGRDPVMQVEQYRMSVAHIMGLRRWYFAIGVNICFSGDNKPHDQNGYEFEA
jgi:hypothetical protein